jgi:hypothetical protein
MGRNIEGVDEEIATAFGVFALTDAELHEAARQAGVTRWELEDAIEEAGLAEAFDIDGDSDVTETIDSLLDGDG